MHPHSNFSFCLRNKLRQDAKWLRFKGCGKGVHERSGRSSFGASGLLQVDGRFGAAVRQGSLVAFSALTSYRFTVHSGQPQPLLGSKCIN